VSPVTRGPAGIVTGNTYDKYGSANPVVRRLMRGFEAALDELLDVAAPESLLDFGCGEGVLTRRWAQRLAPRRVVGVDLEDPGLRAAWASPPDGLNLEYRVTEVGGGLPFRDGEFDTVAGLEVLEHVGDPAATLAELARVASRHLLLSVPREPLFRALNLARGAYVRDLGNTPGHLGHWSRRGFVAECARVGHVVGVRSPVPWTVVLVRL
jgi:2-polyprenyl-3-methyl-5-hydroxy-6-metoxy-1,4-benzoquinol methylase